MTDLRDIEALRYALAKQVPAMECGFTIQTSYGELVIDIEDAGRFVALARSILKLKLSLADCPGQRVEMTAERLLAIAEQFRRAEAMFDVVLDGWHQKEETYLAARTGLELVAGAADAVESLLSDGEVQHG